MANAVGTQVLEDGPQNYVFSVRGILDTSDLALQALIDPATFLPQNTRQGEPSVFTTKVKRIEYSIEDGLAIYLWWQATADVLFGALVGRGVLLYDPPLENTGGAGKTGVMRYQTQGWSAAAVLSFDMTLYCIKAFR